MQKGEIMISTYDDEIDTITQIMIDWFTKRIRQLDEFNQDQIYQSTLMIDEKTPLPCIGFYRNRIEPYKGNDKCVGKEKYSFDFAVCYFTNPTTPEYYNNVLSIFNPITEIFPDKFEKENKFDKFNCGKLYS